MEIIVKTDFSRYSDDQLLSQAQAVINALTYNIHFPAPDPTVEVLTTKTTVFRTILANTKDGDKKWTDIKNKFRDELEVTLNRLALYIQKHCNNDANLVLGTGFDIRKDNE